MEIPEDTKNRNEPETDEESELSPLKNNDSDPPSPTNLNPRVRSADLSQRSVTTGTKVDRKPNSARKSDRKKKELMEAKKENYKRNRHPEKDHHEILSEKSDESKHKIKKTNSEDKSLCNSHETLKPPSSPTPTRTTKNRPRSTAVGPTFISKEDVKSEEHRNGTHGTKGEYVGELSPNSKSSREDQVSPKRSPLRYKPELRTSSEKLEKEEEMNEEVKEENNTEFKTETKDDTDKTETEKQDDAKPEQDAKPETKPETKSDTKPETKSDTKPETKSDTKPETKSDTKPETKSDTKPETKSDTKPETKSDTKPEFKAVIKPEAKSETKTKMPFSFLFYPKPKKKEGKNKSEETVPRVIFARCYSDLPEEIKKKIKTLKLDEDKINAHWETFVYILRHTTKESFRIPDMEIPRSEKHTNVSAEMIQKSTAVIKIIEKDKELRKRFDFIETSGKGGFGRVFCAKIKATKEIVAIKRLPSTNPKEEWSNACEVACLTTFKHPNILEFRSAYKLKDEMWIETEFMEGGTLSQAIKVHTFIEPHIAYITKQLLQGLLYLHSKGFVHRDLKSNNIMMSISGNVKLIDFGLCADLSGGARVQMLGTAFWMSPEMIQRHPHTVKADIWSFGVVFLEMFLRYPPFNSSRILSMFKAITGETLECLESSKIRISEEAHNFVARCLIVDPDKRADTKDLLEDPFVAKATIDKELLVVLKTIFVSLTLIKSGI